MDRPQDPVPQPWYVLIEETSGSGERQRWKLTSTTRSESRDAARAAAADLAKRYVPEHPKRERQRTLFRTGDDVWTVWVEGAMSDFHFRVSVAQVEAG